MNTSFQRPVDREVEVASTCKSWTNADSYLIAVYIYISAAHCTEGPGRRREGLGRGRRGRGRRQGRGKGQLAPYIYDVYQMIIHFNYYYLL